MHSANTRVMCRFCREDAKATERGGIGAEEGEDVFALDGSVLFDGGDGDDEGIEDIDEEKVGGKSCY